MALDLSINRPKLAQTVAFDLDLTVGSATEDDGSGYIFIPITCQNIDPPSFTVTATTTNSSTTLTSSNAFGSVRVGDSLSGTNIAGGATVTAKASNSSLTMSAAATDSGSTTVTVDPPSITSPTAMGLKVSFTVSGAITTPSIQLLLYDGTLGSTAGSVSNYSSAITLSPSQNASFDFDAFLTNLRYTRTNS